MTLHSKCEPTESQGAETIQEFSKKSCVERVATLTEVVL